MRKRIPALVLFGVAFVVFAESTWEMPKDWVEARPPVAIAEDLYYVGSAELGAYLLTSDEGHLLIDAPMEENVELVLKNIRALGYDPRDIRRIVATHGHFDHTGGMAGLLKATGAELWLSPLAAELVGAGGKGDFELGDTAPYPPARASREIADGEVVSVGGWSIRAEFTPGHTRGCTSWSFEAEIDGSRFPGVLVCSLSVLPRYRLSGEDESYAGIGKDFCRSVARLESLDGQIFLSNHGSFMDLDAKRHIVRSGERKSAFVDPEGYRRYLKKARRKIEQAVVDSGVAGGCAELLRED